MASFAAWNTGPWSPQSSLHGAGVTVHHPQPSPGTERATPRQSKSKEGQLNTERDWGLLASLHSGHCVGVYGEAGRALPVGAGATGTRPGPREAERDPGSECPLPPKRTRAPHRRLLCRYLLSLFLPGSLLFLPPLLFFNLGEQREPREPHLPWGLRQWEAKRSKAHRPLIAFAWTLTRPPHGGWGALLIRDSRSLPEGTLSSPCGRRAPPRTCGSSAQHT